MYQRIEYTYTQKEETTGMSHILCFKGLPFVFYYSFPTPYKHSINIYYQVGISAAEAIIRKKPQINYVAEKT